jgi:tetratricopeptide (TPR) repeat protein
MFIRFLLSISIVATVVSGMYAPLAAAANADRVRLVRGSENGEVSDMTPLEVTLNKGQPGAKTIAVNQIKTILFDGEPPELAQARVNVANGAYDKALRSLEKIDADQVRREFVKQDVEFYQAYAAAKLALGGEGEITEAGRKLNTFVRGYPKNFHYLEASEMMGDLLMVSGRFENAQKQYAELAKTPWPDYKIRAAVALGRTLQAQNKHAEAIQKFDAALAMADDGTDAHSQRLSATLGKAVSLAETGKVDEAVGIIEKVIHDADPQEKELHARAYNALGTCYEKANKDKDALLAFLHVDVLYNTVPEAHAEALAHLVPLWKQIGQEERARESRELLQERYAGSRWAKQLQ